VDRRLLGIEIAGEPLDLNQVPWPVEVGGEGVGRVTSAVHSPRLHRNIGYAWVPIGHAEDASSLTVVTPHGAREATVVTMPFVDPGKRIPRA
jgi:aminomethyltransferase